MTAIERQIMAQNALAKWLAEDAERKSRAALAEQAVRDRLEHGEERDGTDEG